MKNKSVYILLSIVLFSIIMHLKGITSPLLDFHAWRQTQTAMIARNYYENGFKFFNPQVDWYGQESNKRAGTEFPVFSFIIALLYKMFGMHDILGRFLAVFFSVMSSDYVFFIKICRINNYLCRFVIFYNRVLVHCFKKAFIFFRSLVYIGSYLYNCDRGIRLYSSVYSTSICTNKCSIYWWRN